MRVVRMINGGTNMILVFLVLLGACFGLSHVANNQSHEGKVVEVRTQFLFSDDFSAKSSETFVNEMRPVLQLLSSGNYNTVSVNCYSNCLTSEHTTKEVQLQIGKRVANYIVDNGFSGEIKVRYLGLKPYVLKIDTLSWREGDVISCETVSDADINYRHPEKMSENSRVAHYLMERMDIELSP